MMRKMGINPTDSELMKMVEAVDSDSSGEIDFEEFVTMLSVVDIPTSAFLGDDSMDAVEEKMPEEKHAPEEHKMLDDEVPQDEWEEYTDQATGRKYYLNK